MPPTPPADIPKGPCCWREGPGLPACGRRFARRSIFREVVDDRGGWRWVQGPLCWLHYGRLRRSPVAMPSSRQGTLTQEQLAEARRLRAEGMPWVRIGEAIGCHRTTAMRAVRHGYLAEDSIPTDAQVEAVAGIRPRKTRPKMRRGRKP